MVKDIINNLYTFHTHQSLVSSHVPDDFDEAHQQHINKITDTGIAKKIFHALMDSIHKGTTSFNFHKHTSQFAKLQGKLQSGQNYASIIEEEQPKYQYLRNFSRLENDFIVKFNSLVASVMDKFSNTEEDFNKKKDYILFCVERSLLDSEKCSMCGLRFGLIKGIFTKTAAKTHDTDCVMADIQHQQEIIVDLPTGVLFIGDTFPESEDLINKYTNIKSSEIYEKLIQKGASEYDIVHGSSAINEYAETVSKLEKNVISIRVGNTSPVIFKNSKKISFVSYNEDSDVNIKRIKEEKLRNYGNIYTDVGYVTIIDESYLDKILSKEYSQKHREELKQHWIETYCKNKIKVKAGKYKLTFNFVYGALEHQTGENRFTEFFKLEPI